MVLQARERRRVLIAAGAEPSQDLLALFSRDPLSNWETRTAGSFSAARFMLQHTPCDVLLVHEDLYHREGAQGLAWLAFQRETPVLFLGSTTEQFTRAYELGAALCLPCNMADNGPLLHATIKQTLNYGQLRQLHERTHEQLLETRRHVDRLVNLIWRITPLQSEHCWLPQRHLLERLEEELVRSQRHHVPFSVAVGELEAKHFSAAMDVEEISERIVQAKRRCDIVGQYGPRGFLLLMVHTPREGAAVCCQRLQQHLAHPAVAGPHSGLRMIFGLASTSEELSTPQALLRMAEQNLEAARMQGRIAV